MYVLYIYIDIYIYIYIYFIQSNTLYKPLELGAKVNLPVLYP